MAQSAVYSASFSPVPSESVVLCALEGQRPRYSVRMLIHPAGIAHRFSILVAPPDTGLVRVAVAALRAVRRGAGSSIAVSLVRINELLWTRYMPLLYLQSTRVTKSLIRGGVTPPVRRACRTAVGTPFHTRDAR